MRSRQAFPMPVSFREDVGRIIESHPGMTLAEFFAAHAPTEIPEWFQTPNLVLRGPRPQPADYFPSEEAQRLARDWTRDPIYELQEALDERNLTGATTTFCQDMNAWWAEGVEVDRKNQQTRYFAWRRFYGEQMAEEMSK